MPLVQAAAAAAGGRVLGNEYRMAAHGGLPSVIRDDGRSKAFGDKILRMAADGIPAFVEDILTFLYAEMEAAAEPGAGQQYQHAGISLLVGFRLHGNTCFL